MVYRTCRPSVLGSMSSVPVDTLMFLAVYIAQCCMSFKNLPNHFGFRLSQSACHNITQNVFQNNKSLSSIQHTVN